MNNLQILHKSRFNIRGMVAVCLTCYFCRKFLLHLMEPFMCLSPVSLRKSALLRGPLPIPSSPNVSSWLSGAGVGGRSIREKSFQWNSTSGNTDDRPALKAATFLCCSMELQLPRIFIPFLIPGLGLVGWHEQNRNWIETKMDLGGRST